MEAAVREGPPTAGRYVLLLRLEREMTATVGRLGRCTFDAGVYAYAGSAIGGMASRLARHARRRKRVHWHVDRLTTSRGCRVLGAVALPPHGPSECEAVVLMVSLPGARVFPPRFGSSDHRCAGHLVHLRDGYGTKEAVVGILSAPSVGGTWLSLRDIRRPGRPRRRRR